MIIVRLLSPEPFGWFAPPKFTRGWEPTLLWNHLHSLTRSNLGTALDYRCGRRGFGSDFVFGFGRGLGPVRGGFRGTGRGTGVPPPLPPSVLGGGNFGGASGACVGSKQSDMSSDVSSRGLTD